MIEPAALFATLLQHLLRRTEQPCLGPVAEFLDSPDDRRLSAAFVLTLAGDAEAGSMLQAPGAVAQFFAAMGGRVRSEINWAANSDPSLASALEAGAEGIDIVDDVWAVTFPEGVGLLENYSHHRAMLRERRRITAVVPNPAPIVDPVGEVLFTANVLVAGDGNDYPYDHPIPAGAPPDTTELAHGLRQLDGAVAVEVQRHEGWQGPLAVALSVSSTSDADRGQAGDFVRAAIRQTGPYPHLRLFVFDEPLTRRLWEALTETPSSRPVFGVAGPYGRHYSFLKAIGAVWSVCVDTQVAATFKIDLDQSFPQGHLIAETGASALEHLTTPLWGGNGVGSDGRTVELALIAGGLVDAGDIDESVFAPDVLPAAPTTPEDAVFFSRLPQAVSTEAEICARATDGILERVHITGGTNGVRIDSLRRWRLFTPSFVGRAEDQAYILSGLGDPERRPAYLHAPGLRMRHDKADLIPDVIAANEGSKHIGDLLRVRLFTAMAHGHKSLLDPFTGAFVSRLPLTVASLRLALHSFALPGEQANAYLREGVERLAAVDDIIGRIDDTVADERREWDRFYDALDTIDAGIRAGEPSAHTRAAEVRAIIAAAEVG